MELHAWNILIKVELTSLDSKQELVKTLNSTHCVRFCWLPSGQNWRVCCGVWSFNCFHISCPDFMLHVGMPSTKVRDNTVSILTHRDGGLHSFLSDSSTSVWNSWEMSQAILSWLFQCWWPWHPRAQMFRWHVSFNRFFFSPGQKKCFFNLH